MVASDTNSRVKWNRVVRHKKITVTYLLDKCLDFHYGWSDAGKVPLKITGLSNQNCVQPKCVQQLEF